MAGLLIRSPPVTRTDDRPATSPTNAANDPRRRLLLKEVCMQATYHEGRTNRGWTICLCLLTVMVLATACTLSQSQTLIGSAGAGWQTWNLAKDADGNFIDLNSNLSP